MVLATSIMMNILVMLKTVPTYFSQQRIGREHQQDFHIDDPFTDKKFINTMDTFYTDTMDSDTDTGYLY